MRITIIRQKLLSAKPIKSHTQGVEKARWASSRKQWDDHEKQTKKSHAQDYDAAQKARCLLKKKGAKERLTRHV